MIKLPKLNSLDSSRSMISAFGGYDHRLVTSEGYFFNENNLTSDSYPVMSTRAEHGIKLVSNGDVKAIHVKDEFCYVVGNKIHIGDKTVTVSDLGTVKQMLSMGAYLVILNTDGDLFYANTKNLDDYGKIAYKYTSPPPNPNNLNTTTAEFYATDETGKLPSDKKPDKPQKGDLYFNGTELERYSGGSNGKWEKVQKHTAILQYNRNEPDFGEVFHVGETVFVSGIESSGGAFDDLNNKGCTIVSIVTHTVTQSGVTKEYPCLVLDFQPDDGAMVGTDYVVKEVTIERRSRKLDYICVSNNRLWGCYYGDTENGFINEIYASKLGDFKNFDYFPGTAYNSYVVGVGSDGAFTGAITFQGNPVFFKEGYIHKVVGTLPSNYQMQTTECQGVKDGSHKSPAIIDNTLFYHANSGIYAYDGSLPQLVSSSLGNSLYSNAVGGSYLRKYYVNMQGADGVFSTFVYDVDKGIWHKQDEGKHIDMFASTDDALYFTMVNYVYSMFGTGETDSHPIKWYAESGIIGTDSPDHKSLSRITVRMSLAFDSTMMIFVEYDSSNEWIPVATIVGDSLNSFSLPIKIERCDHFRMRFDGVGECKIFSITKTIERGAEV